MRKPKLEQLNQNEGMAERFYKENLLRPSELLDRNLNAIKNKDFNAFVTVTEEIARAQSELSDLRVKKGQIRPLEGIPIAIKDNFCTKGILTTAGSKILQNFIPTYESTVTKNLWAAGAICLGKTNMDEFGMGSSTENSYHGPSINPAAEKIGLKHITPGGSSGGSAAAVAANQSMISIGTDTGGSIRQPASFCGLFGMKPTYGLCSRWGVIAYASSLDQPGVIGNTPQDIASIFDIIAKEDNKDTTSLSANFSGFGAYIGTNAEGLRIGIPEEFLKIADTSATKKVWQQLENDSSKIGAKLVPISLKHIDRALQCYYIIALSEASSNLARYDGVRYGFRADGIRNIDDLYEKTRSEGFGEEVKRRIITGTFCLSSGYYDAYYNRALKVRRLISEGFSAAFKNVDVIAWPTTPTSAFKLGSHSSDPTEMYLEDVFTVPVNLAGIPAISIPFTVCDKGLPLGLTLAADIMKDDKLLGYANAIHSAGSR